MNIKYPVLMLTVTAPGGDRMFGHFSLEEWAQTSLISFIDEAVMNGSFSVKTNEYHIYAPLPYDEWPEDAQFSLGILGYSLGALAREVDRAHDKAEDLKVPAETLGVNLSFRFNGWALVVKVAHNDFQVMEGMKQWGVPLEEAVAPVDRRELVFSEEELDADAVVLQELGFNPPRLSRRGSKSVPPSSDENA